MPYRIVCFTITPVENGYTVSADLERPTGIVNQPGRPEYEHKCITLVAQGGADEAGKQIRFIEAMVAEGEYE